MADSASIISMTLNNDTKGLFACINIISFQGLCTGKVRAILTNKKTIYGSEFSMNSRHSGVNFF